MSSDTIRTALNGAIEYLSENPADARATDSVATAVIEDGLRCVVTGPDGAETHTDMVTSVGGANSAPSPGWLFRAATASCVATLIAMKAALDGVELSRVEVEVDSESDDLGILGIDEKVPAGPLSVAVRVKLGASEGNTGDLQALVEWAHEHCPVCDAIKREIPITLQTEVV
jgi:uncharacterized OsmC-like protein